MKKMSLLDLLVAKFPDYDRETLLSWVLCGEVYVAGERVKDPKRSIPSDSELERRTEKYVSRAGEKLEAALHRFRIAVEGKVFLDVGAATGGFTDCLLQHGAAHVHTVDVARNMLDYRIRNDSRVTVHEETNARDIPSVDPAPHAAVCDLSFRSLRGIAGALLSQAGEGWGLFLVKPQFEIAALRRREPSGGENAFGNAGEPEFDGVIRSREESLAIVRDLLTALPEERAYPHDICLSPVRGRKGNREYVVLLRNVEAAEPTALQRLGQLE